MLSLSPWRSGWAVRAMNNGTPVWQDPTYGNTPLVEAIYSIASEVIQVLFPTETLTKKSEYVENMVNGVFSHPDRDAWGYNNPRQFDDYVTKAFAYWRTLPKYVAPSAAVVNAWSAAVNATQPLTGYNLIEGYKAPPRQLPAMRSLSPWRSGWATRTLPNGTPVWQDATYGNAAAVEAIYDIAENVVPTVFPNRDETFLSNEIKYMVDLIFSHPDRDAWGYNNPRQFDDYMTKVLPIWRTYAGFVAPSASQLAFWSKIVNSVEPLTAYNLIEGYKAPARQLPAMRSLSPWRAGWADRTLPNGTPVWQDAIYGNEELIEAIYDNAENVVPTLFPNRDEIFLSNEIKYMADGIYSHPDRVAWSHNNPRQFDDYMTKVLPIWRTYAGFVNPSAAQLAFWSKIVNSVEPLTAYNLIEGSVKPALTVPGTTPLPVAPVTPTRPIDIPTGFLTDPYETEKESSNSTVIILGAVVAYLLLKK